jgi:imidazolonepropionase-like amidohydrolase
MRASDSAVVTFQLKLRVPWAAMNPRLRSPLRRLVPCAGLWLILAAAGAAPEPDVLVLEDVTVIDGTGAPGVPHRDLVIRGGRIEEITAHQAKPVPHGAVRRALPGRFVIPGLVDLHAHVTFLREPATLSGYSRETSEDLLKILLAFGITTARNPQAPTAEGVALRDDVRRGLIPGPRLFTAGDSLNWKDASPGRVTAEVRRQARAGVDFVKLYSALPEPLVAEAIAEAHRDGIKVIGHLQRTGWSDALRLGIDALTHGASWSPEMLPVARRDAYAERVRTVGPLLARLDWLAWLDVASPEVQRMIAELARTRTPIDPTLIAYDTKFRLSRYRTSPDLAYAPPAVRETWRDGGSTSNWTEAELRRADALWPKALGLVKAYHRGGVLLGAGSDVPNPFVVPGVSLHQELGLLGDAGLTPLEVLRVATRNGAEALGVLSETGTVEAGKAADLVVLGADPTVNLAHTRRIEIVVQGGRMLDPARLLAEAGLDVR